MRLPGRRSARAYVTAAAVAWMGLRAGAFESEERILERMRQAFQDLETLEAEIEQVESYPLLGLTDPPERGRLWVRRRDSSMDVRLEIVEPERRILNVKDGRYTIYQPKIRQAIVGNAREASAGRTGFLRFLIGDLDQVQDDHEVAVLGKEPVRGRTTVHLSLVPERTAEVSYRRIDLWVDAGTHLPIREELIEANGDRIQVDLDDIRRNVPIESSRFELDLPDDVDRIRGS